MFRPRFAELKDVRMGAEVAQVTPASAGGHATVRLQDGSEESFDAVVLATHSDTSLQLLADQAPQVGAVHLAMGPLYCAVTLQGTISVPGQYLS